jgi:hypothetical protein
MAKLVIEVPVNAKAVDLINDGVIKLIISSVKEYARKLPIQNMLEIDKITCKLVK